MNEIIKQDDFPYGFNPKACDTCAGNCCIGESGYIWINKTEQEDLAKLLNIEVDELVHKFLRKVGYKYTINEKRLAENNYACVFFDLEKRQCSVYEARPKQCRTFPFWDYFKTRINEVKEECPAIKDI
ncbi:MULTISPECIES: YkgJ family cysteine cluster protein [unclassified Arcobacter]|jgi:Fe-S-cluster containining protein|uniref:YkgJ family cysteine cluster protein n=1 Tax=unclassified Arcobacter TaxID=2593671 RepID=UPI003B00EE27|tara:strand:- start:728 stop:1111 length:384 start_codon:yes stop_codon:yes gene_type:complete